MVPMPRFRRQCDEQFVIGEEYPLTILEARSRNSHNHYFASLHEVWKNLPEEIAQEFPSPEHMRKWALCKTGYSTMKNFVCETNEHAVSLAAFCRSVDTYAVIELRGNIVRIHEANSQSAAEMGGEEFQKSKQAVFDKLSELIQVPVGQIRREGARTFPEPKKVRDETH
jgi:hypothetical protein